jgi:hypothetical protein
MLVTLLNHQSEPLRNSSLNRSAPAPSADIQLTRDDLLAGQFEDMERIYQYSLDLGTQNTNTRINIHIQLNVDSLSVIEYKAVGSDGKLDVISMSTLSNNSNINFHRLTVIEHE